MLRAWLVFLLAMASPVFAVTGGSISGVVLDPDGMAIPGATIKLTNMAQRATYNESSDAKGLYWFPNLPVGRYELVVSANGFATTRKTEIVVDMDASLRIDMTLAIGTQAEVATVSSGDSTIIDRVSTYLGQVVSSAQMTALPLNARLHPAPKFGHHGRGYRKH
jgi:hypothetical protein